jgi:TolA-binding protein
VIETRLLGLWILTFALSARAQDAAPESAAPASAAPASAAPASAAPESAAPESAAPESAAPAAPESAAPASAAPDSGAPAGAPASGAPASAGTGDAQELGLQIEELTTEVARFAEESAEYRADGTRLIEHKYERRKREIKQRYNKVVEELQLEERRRRGDAISRFEEFLQRYPDNPRYTPDAMFRLAELHFERANDVYVTALERYDSEISAFDAGKSEVEPEEPTQDYGRTIDLFGELIRRWPRYRNIDGAYYLRGYCLLEMGKDEEALDQFRILVRTFPKSRFVPETWTRIGEYHFDKNELNEAISAYEKVLAFPDSTYFDKALYKLGWTHYLADQYDPAIKRFRQLIEFSDARVERTGEAGSDLRAEASSIWPSPSPTRTGTAMACLMRTRAFPGSGPMFGAKSPMMSSSCGLWPIDSTSTPATPKRSPPCGSCSSSFPWIPRIPTCTPS